jgi:zinc D-Ala-D-Ala carboxypeptidase
VSAVPGPSSQSRPSLSFHWGFYVLAGLALAGVLVRLAGRTLSLDAQAVLAASQPTELPPAVTPGGVALAAANATAPGPAATLPAPQAVLSQPTQSLITPTPTIIPGCELYNPANDLLIRVDRDTALPREYEPDDLAAVPLPAKNAYYGALLLRRLVHQPLLDLLDAANAEDLQVTVVSGYRSYSDQSLAYEKWLERYPDRVANLSAVPGHSEHQTGLAIDFSTPYMQDLFGEQFHPQFFYTKEGKWLSDNAPGYGFVMSYPSWAVEQTSYEWEPWHYRYVGVELAQYLTEQHMTLSAFISKCSPAG